MDVYDKKHSGKVFFVKNGTKMGPKWDQNGAKRKSKVDPKLPKLNKK